MTSLTATWRTMHQLAIDVGGTFTDLVAIDAEGRARAFKRLTTPADPSRGVLDGTAEFAAAAGLPIAELTRVIHGTTLVANSLITRRGARTALITTAGFRDVLELGGAARHLRPRLAAARTARAAAAPVRGRRARGSKRARAAPARRGGGPGARARAACGGGRERGRGAAERLPQAGHERRLGALLAELAPEIDVTLSSEIAPEWREYERSSTAAANAFVRPLVRRYLARLEPDSPRSARQTRLFIMLSQGGLTTASVAAQFAVQLVESGPVGGVLAAQYFGRRVGFEDVIAFDMGGTTTKVSVIERGTPLHVTQLEVARVARFKRGSGLPLQVPTVELIEIGAGGGSLGRRDNLGLLKVGPESAAAVPGPACYGRGGTEPTVTDADLHLGMLDPANFLGGRMTLQPELAAEALSRLGGGSGLDATRTAAGMLRHRQPANGAGDAHAYRRTRA